MFIRFVIISIVFGTITAGFSAGLPAETGEVVILSIEQWADSLPVDERVPGQVELYAAEKKKEFEEGYVTELVAGIREIVIADISKQFDSLLKGGRNSLIDVSVLDPGFATGADPDALDKTVTKFEKSFVRTEVVAFFDNPDITPEAALRIYVDPGFRKSVSSRIEEITRDGNETCEQIAGVKIVMSPIKYCSRIDELNDADISIQHSQAISNDPDDDYQPIYFKESVKAFVAVPGGLALYYINYSRSVGLGGIKKKIALKKLKESQQKAIDELTARIDDYAPAGTKSDDAGQDAGLSTDSD